MPRRSLPQNIDTFTRRVHGTCRLRKLLGPADHVLAAISGGPDSTALLAALADLRDQKQIAGLTAAHVDHRLRAGSASDARFCRELCERLAVPIECVEVTVAPGNVQSQARQARYAALGEAAARCSASRIATGHTRSDQAETVLLRLVRGAGTRGLAAIPPRRGLIVRPLIDRTRGEVLAFLARRNLPFIEDPTNATPRYLRNRVRAEVLPALRRLNPSVEDALARAADLCRADERALDLLAVNGLGAGAMDVALAQLEAKPLAIRRRMVRRIWRQVSGTRQGLSSQHVEAVLRLARRTSPGRIALPRGFEARCAYGVLAFVQHGERNAESITPSPEIEVTEPGTYLLPGKGMSLVIGWKADALADIAQPLRLRTRRPGDRFRPARGAGSKSLKRWLIDRKVPREARDGLLLLVDQTGQVLWIPELSAYSEAVAAANSDFDLEMTPAP